MEQALTEYLLNALWQLPLLAGSAWVLLWLLRPSPQNQHRVWLAVLGLAVVVPLHGMGKRSARPVEYAIAAAASAPPTAGLPRGLRLGPHTTRWLVRLYLVSFAFGLLRIARAWGTAKHLVKNSHATCLGGQTLAAFQDYGEWLGVKLPQLRTSELVSSPMVVGVRTATLLLPEEFASHTENEMKAALCHELVHVQRHDYLVNFVCEVAALPLAWHPAIYEVQQKIRITREMVCDAMAAAEMDSQIGYAKCLLALAKSMLGEHGVTARPQVLGLFSKNTLEERVMQLTEATTMKARTRAARVATGLGVMVATGAIAVTFHVTPTMAQSEAQPSAAAVISPAPAPRPEPSAPTPVAKAKASHARRKAPETAEQRRRKQALENAHQQMARAEEMLQNPEFQQRMEDAQRQMAKAADMLNNPEFKQRIQEDVQRQIAKATDMLNNPEFKQRIQEDVQRQMAKATDMLNNPEFKQRMAEDVQREMEEMDQRMKEAFPPAVDTPNN